MKGHGLMGLLVCCAVAATAQARAPRGRQNSGADEALLKSGLDSLDHKEYTVAIDEFQKLAKARGDSASYFLLGYAYYQRGFLSGSPETADRQDALETVQAYKTALALDPALEQVARPHQLWHSLALSYEVLGYPDRAMDAYKNAIRTAPENPLPPLYAARLRLKMGDLEKSVDNLALSLSRARQSRQERAVIDLIKASPLFAALLASPAHAGLLHSYDDSIKVPSGGMSLAATAGPHPAARPARDADLRDAVRDTAPAEARAALARKDQAVKDQVAAADEEVKFRRYREAVVLYGEALRLDQTSGVLSPAQLGTIHERLGAAYNRLGQTAQAIRELRRSLQQAPLDPAAHYELALAYSVAGQYRDSLRALNDTFAAASSTAELRRYALLAKTDAELEPVRDLPAFPAALAEYSSRLHARPGR